MKSVSVVRTDDSNYPAVPRHSSHNRGQRLSGSAMSFLQRALTSVALVTLSSDLVTVMICLIQIIINRLNGRN